MANLHGIAVDEMQLLHQFGTDEFDIQQLLFAAHQLGMKAKTVHQKLDRFDKAPLPAVAVTRSGVYFLAGKYIAGSENDTARLLVQFPQQAPRYMSVEEFRQETTGNLVFFTSKASFAGALAKFDFTWFIPAIVKYRRLLGEVLLISIVLQIIGLVTPLFFQVVMDKVLVNHAMKTLNVIAVGLVCAICFDVAFTSIRSWIFAHTSSKIDVELGARLFRHLINLPLAYFHSRRVGDSVARVRELENIRSFLTGNAMTVVMDMAFSVIFLIVMLYYSVQLTLVVIFSIPLYILLSVVCTPIIKNRLDAKFAKGSENQSFLVESISNIDTVKSMAVEPRWVQKWDQQLASYVRASLSVNNIGTLANAGVTLISKLVSALIMWLGAMLVIDQKLTVGELVAFNMLSSQVANPILRLAQLWNDFQQVGVSMSRLGDVLNTVPEVQEQKTRLPKLAGAIEFDQVSFRYRPDNADVIRQLSLGIRPGEVIGIVGRSGSGKSTLTKLVQRLFVPDRGRVLIDGQDIAIVDTASLRQQIGVVLQENSLFNRSVRDNIALVNPTLPIEAIIEVAELAGAHEFICELPQGYDTMVGEHGTGLSGGQRQRIAIARALLCDPRILILDEATSALDYESEKIIQDNMQSICQGRTVLIIAHRLSAVRHANRIIVMEHGQMVECGSHEELLRNSKGIYAHLFSLQQGVVEAVGVAA
ncbi:Toxin RTX-I translocation ATP-binding protein [Ralstonia chuxiongensis]|nr:Toxin RTX-I translocation ATP-binding protein [Ralstonia chuxiongensis]